MDYVIPPMLASSEDYATWTGADAPTNIEQILRDCSALVLDATRGATYDVDSVTGLATDPTTLAALRDMTCAQAAAWVALKIDPNLAGVTTATVKTSKKIGSAGYEIASSDAAAASQARQAALTSLVPSAQRIGRLHGLLGREPYAF
jgi:hypothetical protein